MIDNLLDNSTSENRKFVDKRLSKLKDQNTILESWLKELGKLESSQDNIKDIVSQVMKFISSLEYTLNQGLPQEKLVAVRQCVERIWIDHTKRKIKIQL